MSDTLQRAKLQIDSLEQVKQAQWYFNDEELETALEEYEQRVNKLQSISNVYAKTDRILTGDDITIKINENAGLGSPPSWTDGKEIVFNAKAMLNNDHKEIVMLNALNYHEVAHILYSPRASSEFALTIMNENLLSYFNALEDSRVERLLIAKYPAVAPYIEAGILEHMVGDGMDNYKEATNYFPLLTGRKYLNINIRQQIADNFIRKHGIGLARAISKVVNEYRTLAYPKDYNRGLELVREFATLIVYPKMDIPDSGNIHESEHDLREFMTRGRMESGKEQQKQQDNAEAYDNLSDEQLNELEAQAQNDSGEGTSFDERKEQNEELSKLKQDIQNRINDILDNDEVRKDSKSISKSILNNSQFRSTMKKTSSSNLTVSPEVSASAKSFSVALERIRIDSDPAWELETNNGRLNVARAMRSNINDIDKVFDRWHEGNSNNDIDAVILVDTSGSMGHVIQSTLETAWIIKRGIERINGRVAVYKFNHIGKVIYDFNDKASPTHFKFVGSSGGTNPYTTLLEARRLLMNSRKGIKILFMVTDGQWDNETKCNEIIKELNDNGVTTCLTHLGWLSKTYQQDRKFFMESFAHFAQIFKTVGKPKDLIEVAKSLVKLTMKTRH